MKVKPGRKGIYLLPSLFTTAGLFAGFYAIVQAMQGNFAHAPAAIFIAMVMDGLDGRVARWTHTESDFGAEYDSLVDMVSFGLAPALVIYEWALYDLGKLGWLAAFLFAVCAALRLARFNTRSGEVDKRYFYGLPSPSAAAFIASFVWVMHRHDIAGREISILAVVATVAAGALMVSNIRYRSFKDLNLKSRVPFITILAVPLVIILIMLDPPWVLFALFLAYLVSGPVAAVVRRLRGHGKHERKQEEHPPTSKKL